MKARRFFFLPAGIVSIIALLAGCSGGGGSGGGTAPAAPAGSVAVLLADGPADEYDEIRIRITEISLLPAKGSGIEGPVVIYRDAEGHEVDLLDLRDEDLILTVNEDVPAGRYDKIRLKISAIEAKGGPCSTFELPSGKIDLNPRGSFEVREGGSVTVRLDIDANKSIHTVKAGHSGKCIFRPVVFVDIEEGKPAPLCPRILKGTIVRFLENPPGGRIVGFILELSDSRGEVEVRLADGAVIFDADGRAASAREALRAGDVVRVSGRFEDGRRLIATVVVAGEVVAVKGTIAGAVEEGRFPFSPDPGQEIVGAFDVELSAETLILLGCDQRVGEEEIREGVRARAIGKVVLAEGILRAVAILLGPSEVAGEIAAWVPVLGGYRATIRTAGGRLVEVFVPSSAPITLGEDGPVPASLICAGHRARIEVAEDPVLALRAVEVRLDPESIAGAVAGIQPAERLLLVDGKTIRVRPQAVVLIHDASDGTQSLGSFGSIAIGDEVACFGLSTCGDPVVHLEAFIVVIDRP